MRKHVERFEQHEHEISCQLRNFNHVFIIELKEYKKFMWFYIRNKVYVKGSEIIG